MVSLAEKYKNLGIDCHLLKGQVAAAKAMLAEAAMKNAQDALDLYFPRGLHFPIWRCLTVSVLSANDERSFFVVALWNRETIYIFMLWFVLLLLLLMVALCNRADHYIFAL